jgi:DNA helicase-2/ATP-dependent DNA helicase PcrA
LNALELLEEHDEVRLRHQEQTRHLLIDEYQDTNRLQYLLVKQLTQPPYDLCAVGDEDQSIYRFRGAHLGNILEFEKDFPNVRVMKLEQNYRSTQRILEAASSVVRNNRERKEKTLWTRNDPGDLVRCLASNSGIDEAEAVGKVILALKRDGLDDTFAVLYRTNFQSRYFEEVFKRNAIPYTILGGLSFYARAEIKDLVAYLRLLRNPGDSMALDRIINVPARGIGETTMDRLRTHAAEQGLSLWESVEAFARDPELSNRACRPLAGFVHLVQQLRMEMPSSPLAAFLESMAERIGYVKMLEEENSPESLSHLGNIEELVRAAHEWEGQGLSVSDFLDQASLASDSDNYDSKSHVTLMTLHSAKGLEFDVVFLVGMEEGLFPHGQSLQNHADIEEERRLCYVGMTRARRRLYLSWARFRRTFDPFALGENLPSRFLSEIPATVLETIENGYSSRESSAWSSPFQAEVPQKERKPYAGKSYDSVDSMKEFLRRRSGGAPARSGSRAAALPPPPTDPGGPNDFPPGTRVQHPQFGEGVILQALKEGDETKLNIHFSNFGRKKLIQRYSNLVKI